MEGGRKTEGHGEERCGEIISRYGWKAVRGTVCFDTQSLYLTEWGKGDGKVCVQALLGWNFLSTSCFSLLVVTVQDNKGKCLEASFTKGQDTDSFQFNMNFCLLYYTL